MERDYKKFESQLYRKCQDSGAFVPVDASEIRAEALEEATALADEAINWLRDGDWLSASEACDAIRALAAKGAG